MVDDGMLRKQSKPAFIIEMKAANIPKHLEHEKLRRNQAESEKWAHHGLAVGPITDHGPHHNQTVVTASPVSKLRFAPLLLLDPRRLWY